MIKSQVVRSRTMRLLLVLCALIVSAAGPAAAPAAIDTALRISVRTEGGLALQNVHVAIVPEDHSPGRPAWEMIAPTGSAEFIVPPGQYAVVTSAAGHVTDLRPVRVVQNGRNEISVDLKPAKMAGGSVMDTEGNPIAGARIAYAPFVSAPAVAGMSALALQHLKSSMQTVSDADGAWRLPAMPLPLVVEASGYAPGFAGFRQGEETKPVDIALHRGASLHVIVDRIDPEVVVAAVPVKPSEDKRIPPPRVLERVWAREASRQTLEWLSLPAGDYKLVASHPDPLRFSTPVEVGRVTLSSGIANARVTLPPARPAATKYTAVLVPRQTDVSDLRAFVRSEDGAQAARHSTLDALTGKVIFVDTAAKPSDVYLTTRTELMTIAATASKKGLVAVEPLRVAKGEGRLRLIAEGEGVTLPPVANVELTACDNHEQLPPFTVKVAKDGVLSFPFAVPCRALTVSFPDLESLGLTASVRTGEEKFLGDFRLGGSASAEVHVTYAGASMPNVAVRASVMRERQKVQLREAMTDEHGLAVLSGLPPGEVVFEARLGETQHAGRSSATLEAGKRATIDPLEIPEPASIVLSASFDPAFQAENPTAAILGVVVEREGTERPKETRNAEFKGQSAEATFDDLAPGLWHIITMVKIDDVVQPIHAQSVELKSGQEQKVKALVKPALFTGQVVARGQGVQGGIGISDPPGPHAIRRDVQTGSDGRFKVALPKEGPYRVTFRRTVTADPIDLGTVVFDDGRPSVRLELPDASLSVQVRRNDAPVADAPVTATMRVDSGDGAGVARLTRRATTDASGAAVLEELTPGPWTISVREPRGPRTAEKVVTVAKSSRAEATLELNEGKKLNGVVVDERGALAIGASVDCIFPGTAGVLRALHAETDDHGAFSLPLPDPAPPRLDCGVATAYGAIGAFVAAPGTDVELALSPSTGSVTIADWGERVIPDRFWLVSPDGRVFNLSWAARKFGRAWSPLTIARMPAGPWKVVRVDAAAALNAIAGGMARSLPAAADLRLGEGETADIRIQDGPVARR